MDKSAVEAILAGVRAKIDQALDCLAEASEMLSELEKGAAKMNQLRELLREAL